MRKGWEIKTLGEVSDILNGGTPKTKVKEYWGGNINWITPKDLGRLEQTYVSETPRKITDLGLQKSSAKLFSENSIILSTRAPIGHLAINKVPMATNQGCRGIVPNNELEVHYLFYFLKLNVKLLNDLGTGTTFKELSTRSLGSVKIPVPPLPEQKQIVKILDQAFEAIDQAKANIEKNIANAKELFQSKLNEVFSQKGEGWEEKTLGEVCYVLNGYAFKSKDAITESNTQLLRMGNLYKNILDLDRKPVFYPDSFGEKFKDYLIKEGDLIMSLTGTVDKTDYGYTVKVPEIEVDLLLNQRIMKIEVHDPKVLNQDYLKNYLLSPGFLTKLYATSSGTRQANLSSKTILTLSINYPKSLSKQNEIVYQLEKLKEYSVHLENEYNQKLTSLEELKKSILQKAFSGELTNPK